MAERVVVVDNHDSFVHTLVGYLHELGAETVMIEADAVDDADAAIAGFAGVLYSLTAPRDFLMGLPLAVQGFSALVVGGVGRVEGAILGGMILALAEQFTARYADQIGIPSGMSIGVPFLLMIVFLLVRPTGLLKAKEARA